MSIEAYQSCVLGPHQIIDYSGMVMQAYPPEAVQREPFVGFKIMVKDRAATTQHPRFRLEAIDRLLAQILPGTGCMVREAGPEDCPDKTGLWVLTAPVPRSQTTKQLMFLMNVLQHLEQFGIVLAGTYEVNVSGRCNAAETENMLGSLYIPQEYTQYIVNPINTPYRLGHITRINDFYMCYRTRWSFGLKPINEVQKDLIILSQLISAMYH